VGGYLLRPGQGLETNVGDRLLGVPVCESEYAPNTFTTGLTFTLFLVDDAQDAADLGKVVRIGITVKTVVDAETVDLDTAAATETTQDCTLKSTSNQILVQTVAIANAALDSLASGQAMAIRIRRIGTHANDTCNGRALLLGVSVKNT
jgi:hypothetical protein